MRLTPRSAAESIGGAVHGLAEQRSTVDQEAFLPWVDRAVNLFRLRNAYDLHYNAARIL